VAEFFAKELAMGPINPNKAGLALGILIGGWHLLWASLVAVGWAQPVIDFVFWMHFIRPAWTIGTFHPGIALVLISVTAATGYAFGYLFGWLWNWIHG
jgi:hypothetical protein